MTAHKEFFSYYGAITEEDAELLEKCLLSACSDAVIENHPVRICEIGMHDGGTARGMERYVRDCNLSLAYIGIDPDDGSTRPRYVPFGGQVLIGKSADMFVQVPGDLDLVWVDGCHCRNCVVLDVVNFAPKVRVGGFLCLHDTNILGQFRADVGHQYHGPENDPHFALAVRAALAAIRFPWEEWEFYGEAKVSDLARVDCGTLAFRRIK